MVSLPATSWTSQGSGGTAPAAQLLDGDRISKPPRYQGLLAAPAPKPKTPRAESPSLGRERAFSARGHFSPPLPIPISPRQFTLLCLLSFLLLILITHPKCEASLKTPRKPAAAERAVPAVQAEKLTSLPASPLSRRSGPREMERTSESNLLRKCQTPAPEAPGKRFSGAEAQEQEMSPWKSTLCVDRIKLETKLIKRRKSG